MSNTVSSKELAESVEALEKIQAQVFPRSVFFPAAIVKQALEGDPYGIRFQLGVTTGLLKQEVVGFVTPEAENGQPSGETLNSGAPCPPWCPD